MIWFYLILSFIIFIPVVILEVKVYRNRLKIQERILKLLDLDIIIDEV